MKSYMIGIIDSIIGSNWTSSSMNDTVQEIIGETKTAQGIIQVVLQIKEVSGRYKVVVPDTYDTQEIQELAQKIRDKIHTYKPQEPIFDNQHSTIQSDTKTLSLLGNAKTRYTYDQPTMKILETFQNQHPNCSYIITFHCPEFTSLCPKTGQPDFANITINYSPDKLCVESKSLKLYLFSYRNHGEFHEDVTNRIGKDLMALLKPKWLSVNGNFNTRGGIAIEVDFDSQDLNESWNQEEWRKQYDQQEEKGKAGQEEQAPQQTPDPF